MGGRNSWKYMLAAGGILLGILALLAVFVPFLSSQTCTGQDASARNLSPSAEHLFGTDTFGRDVVVRVWYGARISLFIGVGSAFLCGAAGILLGAASGYAGGIWDMLLMRAADLADAVPSLLYVILITLALGANVWSVLLGICVSGWAELARIVRGEVIRLKNLEFCAASRLSGASAGRILWKHLLPNAAGPVIVNLTFFVPKAIFTEAFFSFLGVGISAPAASLGTLIQEARGQMRLYPYQMLYPILVLCLLIAALQLIGMGAEQRQRGEGTA